MSTRIYATLPKCPVCLRRYSPEVKPMILQPCSHGMCEVCITKYREIKDEEGEDIKCPKCREVVIEEKPNYDLIDTMPSQTEGNYWVKKLMDAFDETGVTIPVHRHVEELSKLLVTRINSDRQLQSLSNTEKEEWIQSDIKLIKSMKQELVDSVLELDIEFKELHGWIQVLNLPSCIENYLISEMLTVYENKEFLRQFNAEWLMDLIPTSV